MNDNKYYIEDDIVFNHLMELKDDFALIFIKAEKTNIQKIRTAIYSTKETKDYNEIRDTLTIGIYYDDFMSIYNDVKDCNIVFYDNGDDEIFIEYLTKASKGLNIMYLNQRRDFALDDYKDIYDRDTFNQLQNFVNEVELKIAEFELIDIDDERFYLFKDKALEYKNLIIKYAKYIEMFHNFIKKVFSYIILKQMYIGLMSKRDICNKLDIKFKRFSDVFLTESFNATSIFYKTIESNNYIYSFVDSPKQFTPSEKNTSKGSNSKTDAGGQKKSTFKKKTSRSTKKET